MDGSYNLLQEFSHWVQISMYLPASLRNLFFLNFRQPNTSTHVAMEN